MDLVQKGPPLTDFQGNPVDSDTIKRDIMQQLGVKNDAGLQELLKRSKEVEEETDTPPRNGETPGRVKVTGRDRRRNCRLRPYKEGCGGALPYSTPHHVVPDRAFREPGSDKLHSGGIPHADGVTLCVNGGTPVRSGPNADEHGAIHALLDSKEAVLGGSGTLRRTATLGQLEDNGAEAMVFGGRERQNAVQQRASHRVNHRGILRRHG